MHFNNKPSNYYTLHTWAAIHPHRRLLSPDPTVCQMVLSDVDHWLCQSYPYVYPRLYFVSMLEYFPIVWIDHYMYLQKCQIRVSKTVFCILLYVFASNTTLRKLPPAQLSKACFTAGVACNKHCALTSSAKWDIHGCHVNLCFEFLKMVFAIMPRHITCRNIFFGIYVDCQDINRINGVQLYFTLTVWIMIPVDAWRD